MTKSNIQLACTVFIIVLLYTAKLYFLAATASLRDTYQPGIEHLHIFNHPEVLILLIVFIGIIGRRLWLLRLAFFTSLGALISSLLLFIFVAIHSGNTNTWIPAESRTLSNTVHTALFRPSFSGRSTGGIVFNGLVAGIGLGASGVVLRRWYNKSFKSTPNNSTI